MSVGLKVTTGVGLAVAVRRERSDLAVVPHVGNGLGERGRGVTRRVRRARGSQVLAEAATTLGATVRLADTPGATVTTGSGLNLQVVGEDALLGGDLSVAGVRVAVRDVGGGVVETVQVVLVDSGAGVVGGRSRGRRGLLGGRRSRGAGRGLGSGLEAQVDSRRGRGRGLDENLLDRRRRRAGLRRRRRGRRGRGRRAGRGGGGAGRGGQGRRVRVSTRAEHGDVGSSHRHGDVLVDKVGEHMPLLNGDRLGGGQDGTGGSQENRSLHFEVGFSRNRIYAALRVSSMRRAGPGHDGENKVRTVERF